MIVLCLAGRNATFRWSTIIKDLHADLKNCILNAHSLIGSDNDAIARRQIRFFFPDCMIFDSIFKLFPQEIHLKSIL